tara:strand:- start:74 stop:799 length:726 start_codon:yes stop_codon:yes gene_type:complete
MTSSIPKPKSVSTLELILGVHFSKISLLKTAVTHRSYAKVMNNPDIIDNERLEFLGDAILKLIVSNFLYQHYPNESEGFMTKIRSKVVSDRVLAQLAKEIELGQYIYMSYGEAQSGGANRESILANTFEAMLGALYLDQGYEIAEKVFLKYYLPHRDQLESQLLTFDYKSVLQEWTQAHQLGVPEYHLIKQEGPDHDSTFYIEVRITFQGKQYVCQGNSHSKKSAEQNAAKLLIQDLNIKI